MKKRKNHSPEFKAKGAPEAVREEMTLAELSKKYGVHPTRIGEWKRAAVENMVVALHKGSAPERDTAAEVDKLHSKIGMGFFAPSRACWHALLGSGRLAATGRNARQK